MLASGLPPVVWLTDLPSYHKEELLYWRVQHHFTLCQDTSYVMYGLGNKTWLGSFFWWKLQSGALSQSCRKSLSGIGIITINLVALCPGFGLLGNIERAWKPVKDNYFHFLQSDNFAMTLIRPAFSSLSRLLSSFNFVTVWKGKVSHLVQQKLGLAQA